MNIYRTRHQQKKTVLFITDFGKVKYLGFGHLYRCLNISNYLFKKKNFIVYFKTIKKIPKNIRQENTFIKLPNKKNKFDFIFCDLPNANSIDFYNYKYEKLIIIDEFNNFKKKIKGKVIKSKIIKKFIYLKFSNQLLYKRNYGRKKKINFFVSFGGSDYYNLNGKILNFFLKSNLKNFLFAKKLIGTNKVPIKFLLRDFSTIFEKYKIKLFVGSGGNTMFEMLYNKVPCLIIPTNNIEKKYVISLKKKYQVNFFDFNKKISEQKISVLKKKHFKLDRKDIVKYYDNLFKF